jgi:hypothetical protein
MRSWSGSWSLKSDVLAQVREHHRAARLDPIVICGRSLALYGWSAPVDVAALAAALALPVDLLSIGLYLWDDGLAGDPAGVRDVIDARRELLEAIPVGAELSDVAAALIAWRLVDREWGLERTLDDDQPRALLRDAAVATIAPDDRLVARIHVELARWQAEIPRQWRATGTVGDAVYRHVHALDTAAGAATLARDPTTAGRVIQTSVLGANGVNVVDAAGTQEALRAKLRELLAERSR